MSTPGDPPLENCFLYQVQRLLRALRESFERRLAPHHLSISEGRVLIHCSQGVGTPAGLADCLDIDRAAVTRLVDQLEQKGLLSREPNPTDRRSTVVRLTETGRALVPQLNEYAKATDQEFLGHLQGNRVTELRQLLQEAVRGLPRRSYDGDECPEG